jgi:acylphosphatase
MAQFAGHKWKSVRGFRRTHTSKSCETLPHAYFLLWKGAGSGFRYTTKNVALGFEVTGAVRNLPDGRVELIAEAPKDELEAFRQGIRESGLGSFISNEQVTWEESKGEFRGFEITS